VRNKKNNTFQHQMLFCINFAYLVMLCTMMYTIQFRSPKICCIDVTTSCTNNDTINAHIFDSIMLFTEESIIFRILQGKINVTVQDS